MTEAEAGPDRLTDEAIDLLIRLQNDPGNPISTEMVRAWRATGPEHERAWARVSGIHGVTGKVLTDRRKAERGQAGGVTRRRLIVGAAIGLGSAGTGYALLPDLLIRARADVVTATAEIRQVALPDGSMATLGPASALAFRFGPERRDVELLTGMAYFDVRPDAQRPFAVTADEMVATALGTAFDASSDAGFLTVSVDHGRIEARAPDSALAARARLEAGEWISGVFDLSNPRLALEAVVHPAGARIRQVSSFLTVISPV